MKTLWISILGYASGRTGWVVNNGEYPYTYQLKPIGDMSGIVDRFSKRGTEELKNLARTAEQIHIFSYNKTQYHKVDKYKVLHALDPDTIAFEEYDGLSLLMPTPGKQNESIDSINNPGDG